MSVKNFEDNRWTHFKQKSEFRHGAALSFVPEGSSVLDVGCGDGLFLRLLHERGIDARGIDISEAAAAQCRKDGFVVDVADFTQEPLPYESDSIDYVVALDVLEHVYDPLALLLEMKRVARVGIIIGVPNFSSLPARLQVLAGKVPENNLPHKGHIYWFNQAVLFGLAKKAELTIVQLKANTFSPFTYFGTLAQDAFPNTFALSFVALFEKPQN